MTQGNDTIVLFSFQLAAWEIFRFQFELRGTEVDELGAGEDGVIGIHEFGLDEGHTTRQAQIRQVPMPISTQVLSSTRTVWAGLASAVLVLARLCPMLHVL